MNQVIIKVLNIIKKTNRKMSDEKKLNNFLIKDQ